MTSQWWLVYSGSQSYWFVSRYQSPSEHPTAKTVTWHSGGEESSFQKRKRERRGTVNIYLTACTPLSLNKVKIEQLEKFYPTNGRLPPSQKRMDKKKKSTPSNVTFKYVSVISNFTLDLWTPTSSVLWHQLSWAIHPSLYVCVSVCFFSFMFMSSPSF